MRMPSCARDEERGTHHPRSADVFVAALLWYQASTFSRVSPSTTLQQKETKKKVRPELCASCAKILHCLNFETTERPPNPLARIVYMLQRQSSRHAGHSLPVRTPTMRHSRLGQTTARSHRPGSITDVCLHKGAVARCGNPSGKRALAGSWNLPNISGLIGLRSQAAWLARQVQAPAGVAHGVLVYFVWFTSASSHAHGRFCFVRLPAPGMLLPSSSRRWRTVLLQRCPVLPPLK